MNRFGCLPARTAVLALRRPGHAARKVMLVFPSAWKRAALLAYVREQHPGETVRIIEWHDTTEGDSWEPSRWIANPAAFADYRRGVLYERPRPLAVAS